MQEATFAPQMPFSQLKFFQTPITFLIVPFFALVSCNSGEKKEAATAQSAGPRPPAKVDAFVVQAKSISETLEVPGSLVAEESTEIHPEVSGRIIQLNVREGATVSKGSLLDKLYDADLQAQKRKLEVQIKVAQSNQGRSEQLVKIGGISREDYDASVLNVCKVKA